MRSRYSLDRWWEGVVVSLPVVRPVLKVELLVWQRGGRGRFRGPVPPVGVLPCGTRGLETAPPDYQHFVSTRFTALGFNRLMMCPCIYVDVQDTSVVLLIMLDAFIVFGSSLHVLEQWVTEFWKTFDSTEPVWDSTAFLGLEVSRDWDRCIIQITMRAKILDTCARYGVNSGTRRHDAPMPASGYIIKDSDFDSMNNGSNKLLNKADSLEYLAVVGSLLWISGIHLFAVLYLTWSTKTP